jgi:hypothetical protein
MLNGPQTGYGFESDRKELKMKAVAVDKAGDADFALQVLPRRIAMIVGTFPYKKQIEEFKQKLRLSSPYEVLGESTQDGPAFRFLGVEVQRRTVDPEGKELTPWKEVDLRGSYLPYYIWALRRTEEDEKKDDNKTFGVKDISFRGLAMAKLKQMRDGQYPNVEEELEGIKTTLAKLNEVKYVAPPNPFDQDKDKFDPFNPDASDPGDFQPGMGGPGPGPGPGSQPGFGMAGGPPGAMSGMMKGGYSGLRGAGGKGRLMRGEEPGGPGGPGPGPGTGGTFPGGLTAGESEDAIPEHCLVRLIDVNVKPGEIYQYRLQVKMANPNFGRKDVADPLTAKKPELKSDTWYQVPQNVVIPPDVLYFAVDQKEIGDGSVDPNKEPKEGTKPKEKPKPYNGIHGKDSYNSSRQAVFQIHKWLEAIGPKKDFTVGEWAVLERVFVYRGEFINRDERVDVPYWRTTLKDFVLAAEPGNKSTRPKGIPVHFGHEGSEAILVDFEGGQETFDKVTGMKDDKPVTTTVRDQAAREVVLLSPEGKLLAHNDHLDAVDPDRVERLRKWHERIKEVKEGKKDGNPMFPGTGPFNKGGGPGS